MLLNELKTLFRRKRTIASLVLLCTVPVFVVLAVKLSGAPEDGGGPAFIGQITHTGFFAGVTSLSLVTTFLLPLMVAIVAGDAIAGEANLGTLRYILIRPVSRTRLLVLKYLAILVYSIAASVLVVVVGVIVGGASFGMGKIVSLSGVEIGIGHALWYALLSAFIVAVWMAALGAIGLCFSTMTDQPIGAMVATVTFAVVCEILDSISQFSAIHQLLPTHYWQSFTDLFRLPVSYESIEKGLLVQLIWIAVAATIGWARFTTKDVLA